MTNTWTKNRRVSLAVHLFYILVPALVGLYASVRLWADLFGDYWFAVPLVVSVEGVAAVGLFLKLRGIASPFVPARHILPVFTLSALGYELFKYLSSRQEFGVALGATIGIVGLFGSLFWLAFRTLEGLFIDHQRAAREKIEEDMRPFVEREERLAIENEVANASTLRIREAEQKRYEQWRQHLLQLSGGTEVLSLSSGSGETVKLREMLEQRTRELEHALDEAAKRGRLLQQARQPKDDLLSSLMAQGAQPAKRETVETLEPLFNELLTEQEQLMTLDEALSDPQGFVDGMEETAAAVTATEMCGICGAKPITSSDKSVSRRAFWKKRLGGKDACEDCREARR